jgi:hypothetical protein
MKNCKEHLDDHIHSLFLDIASMYIRSDILIAAIVKSSIFWDVTSCNLIGHQCFGEYYCLHLHDILSSELFENYTLFKASNCIFLVLIYSLWASLQTYI